MATGANATINLNAVDNTRAAFLGVQRNLSQVQRNLQLNGQGIATLARRYISLAAVATTATRTIREVMTATESIKGLDPSVAASVALLRQDFESLFGEVDNAAQRFTAKILGYLGDIGRETGRAFANMSKGPMSFTIPGFFVNYIRGARSMEAATDRANDKAEGLRLVLERIVASPQVQRATQEVDAAMKAGTKNLIELQRMGVEMNSVMINAGPPLSLQQNIDAARELDRQLMAVSSQVEQLRTMPLAGDEDAPKRMEQITAALREQAELYVRLNAVSGNIMAQEKERTRASREAAKMLSKGFEDAVFSGKKLSDVIKQLGIDLMRMAFRSMITDRLADFFTGGFTKILGFADGGRPPVGRPSIVGERGPELFIPSTAGTIIPNHQLGGGSGGSTYYIDARGADQTGLARLEAMIRQTQASIVPMALGAVQDARARGGAFAV
jgi:hypothetical protein